MVFGWCRQQGNFLPYDARSCMMADSASWHKTLEVQIAGSDPIELAEKLARAVETAHT
jgi:hypothetical protein